MIDLLTHAKAALAHRYALERELGSGGMATVYLARDRRYDREVAVKVLKPDVAAAVGAERFLREIRITARLNHPHVLPLLDSGEADGLLYYVMPYVAGGSLRARLRGGATPTPDDAVSIARQVAAALSSAGVPGRCRRWAPSRAWRSAPSWPASWAGPRRPGCSPWWAARSGRPARYDSSS